MSTTKANDIDIYYEVHGQGEPLLLIMGLAYNSQSWSKTIPALSKQFQVIIFDNRGSGRSDKPDSNYTIEMMADDAIAVLDAVGVSAAHIYGVSMGGMIAQRLTLKYPERVKSLILGCTSPGGKNQVQPEADVMMTLLSGAATQKTPLEIAWASVPILYSQDYIENHHESISEDIEIVTKIPTPPHGFMHQLQAILQHDTFEELEKIHVPTLIIHGDADRLIPIQNGKLIVERIKDSEFFVVPGAGHLYMLESQGMVEEKVIHFIRNHSIEAQMS